MWFSILFLQTRSLTKPGVHQFSWVWWPMIRIICLCPPEFALHINPTALGFCKGAWDITWLPKLMCQALHWRSYSPSPPSFIFSFVISLSVSWDTVLVAPGSFEPISMGFLFCFVFKYFLILLYHEVFQAHFTYSLALSKKHSFLQVQIVPFIGEQH